MKSGQINKIKPLYYNTIIWIWFIWAIWCIQKHYRVPLTYDLTTFQILGQKLSNFFVGILVETMTPKGHFEINWPLKRWKMHFISCRANETQRRRTGDRVRKEGCQVPFNWLYTNTATVASAFICWVCSRPVQCT